MTNNYSPHWFELFLRTIPATQTTKEIEFIRRQLVNPPYRTILNLCCGEGRHTTSLARCGYQVTGVDRNDAALAIARRNSSIDTVFTSCDMRYLHNLPGSYDAVICLWQSFGYFDEPTNGSVIGQIAGILRPRGRLILDVYYRGFFERHTGERDFDKNGLRIKERTSMVGNRLIVVLSDASNVTLDQFDWQLYEPGELCDLADSFGFKTILTCTRFDESMLASPDNPRVQLVFEPL